MFQLLLDYGANPIARDFCGKSIAHYSIGPLNKNDKFCDILDACIAKAWELPTPVKLIDMCDRFGMVPVSTAIMCNRVDLVRYCCEKHKCDVTINDNEGIASKCNESQLYCIQTYMWICSLWSWY